uniref:Uncharacterized protein n=1 Tax=Arundo donax TaxID=35708 RepID=A0A0A8YV76_ARUDO
MDFKEINGHVSWKERLLYELGKHIFRCWEVW